MVFGSREMVSGHRSMVLPGSDMPSALGLVIYISVLNLSIYLIPRPIPAIINGVMLTVLLYTGPPYQNSNCTGSHETVCVYKELPRC